MRRLWFVGCGQGRRVSEVQPSWECGYSRSLVWVLLLPDWRATMRSGVAYLAGARIDSITE